MSKEIKIGQKMIFKKQICIEIISLEEFEREIGKGYMAIPGFIYYRMVDDTGGEYHSWVDQAPESIIKETFIPWMKKREMPPRDGCAGYKDPHTGEFDCEYQAPFVCEDCMYGPSKKGKNPQAKKWQFKTYNIGWSGVTVRKENKNGKL